MSPRGYSPVPYLGKGRQSLEWRWSHWTRQTSWSQASCSGCALHTLFLCAARRLSAEGAAGHPTVNRRNVTPICICNGFLINDNDNDAAIHAKIAITGTLKVTEANQSVKRFIFGPCNYDLSKGTMVEAFQIHCVDDMHIIWEGSKSTSNKAEVDRLAGQAVINMSLYKVPWPPTYRSLPSLPSERLCFLRGPCSDFHGQQS